MKQLECNVEAYIDDILIKSKYLSNFFSDVHETLSTIWQHGIKLIPKKYSFGVEIGKFLGYVVSPKGIEVNPSKIQALLDMKLPSTIQEVQQLTEHITALNRFLAKAGDKSYPFYQVHIYFLLLSSSFHGTSIHLTYNFIRFYATLRLTISNGHKMSRSIQWA